MLPFQHFKELKEQSFPASVRSLFIVASREFVAKTRTGDFVSVCYATSNEPLVFILKYNNYYSPISTNIQSISDEESQTFTLA